MAFTSRFSTAPAQSTPWHNTNSATNLSVRHIWPPSDVSIDNAPGDTISALEFAPQKQNVAGFGPCEVLACASWDNQVRLYVVTPILVNPNNPADNNNTNKDMLDTRFEIEKEFPFNFKHGEPAKLDTKAWKAYSHDQPVLAISFDSAGTNLYSGGCDGKVYQYNIHTEQKVEVPVPHQAPVKLVKVFRAPNGHEWLLTAAWDRTYQFRNLSDGSTFPQFPPVPGAGQALLPNRPVAVDANSKIIVIAMSERMVRTYNLSLPNWIQQPDDRLSQLRWQTRSIACFTDEAAYAIGSIEGRIAITYPLDQRMRDGRSVNDTSLPPDRSYSFKCHRQDLKAEIHNPECEQGAHGTVPRGSSNNTSSNNKPQHIFPVNVLCFNKSTKGSFVSGGGDGSLTYWDGLRRSKLRNYWPQDYELPSQPSYLCWTQIETRNDKPKKYTGDYKPYIEAQIAQERAPNPSERQYAAELIARKKPYDDKAAQFGGLRLGLPVCAYAYNSDQTVGAFGVSYDWSKGHAYAPLVDAQGQKDPSTAPRLYLHMQLSVDVTKLEA